MPGESPLDRRRDVAEFEGEAADAEAKGLHTAAAEPQGRRAIRNPKSSCIADAQL